jgi:hypothetical protein
LPRWIAEEICQIEALKNEITGCAVPRRRPRLTSRLDLRLSDGIRLLEGLGGGTRALLVRQLLRALGFDERRHFQWRVEHKLIQALLLRSWAPHAIPVTCGLHALARGHDVTQLREWFAACFPNGYRIKAALGDSSGDLPAGGDPERIFRNLEVDLATAAGAILSERFVVQEEVAIAVEYRVHSLEEDVIEDLTFRRYQGGSIPGERDEPNAFVRSLIERLPDAVVGGSLLAWDIAKQSKGEYIVIEVNFSGFHPEFKRGFHCSGYFHDYHWGACDTARLLNHVARQDGVEVTPHADEPGYPIEQRFYFETARWQRRHRGLPAPASAPLLDPRLESEILEPLLRQIDVFDRPRRLVTPPRSIALRLSAAVPLLPEIAATSRALMTRQVLLALGFDEDRLGRWRLEHKLVQAHVLRHYCPGSLPPTCGLDRLAQGVELRDLRAVLSGRFPQGFIIKTALGDCSGAEIDGRTEAALRWIESGGRYMPGAGELIEEEFIVQERKSISREFRVHTLEDRVIDDLTVYRHQGCVGPGERDGPNRYVQQMLDALPAGIVSGSLLGWDVAELAGGGFATIEVNIGGIHHFYNPGFHVSGFFHHRHYGAIYSARLLLFLERVCGLRFEVIADLPDYPDENHFYAEVADWKARF